MQFSVPSRSPDLIMKVRVVRLARLIQGITNKMSDPHLYRYARPTQEKRANSVFDFTISAPTPHPFYKRRGRGTCLLGWGKFRDLYASADQVPSLLMSLKHNLVAPMLASSILSAAPCEISKPFLDSQAS